MTDIETSLIFIELGVAVIALAILTLAAKKLGFSAIPLYLLAGLAFGNGGLFPLQFSEDFVHIGSEIGVVLLLFMLGLEYTGKELGDVLRAGMPAGLIDFAFNFPIGFIAGLFLGWSPLASLLLGGVTYISSSGIVAKILSELGRMNNPETPTIVSILVIEDLAMAIYLPLVVVLIIGQGLTTALGSIVIALATVAFVLFIAIRYGEALSRAVDHQSDEVILFTTFGFVLLIAGVTQHLKVSAAVGAFLVGIVLSGPIVKRTHKLIGPLRDLFAAIFFLFFGLQIDPASLPPVLVATICLGVLTGLTKLFTGLLAARQAGLDTVGGYKAGTALIARGEFSIVIASLGVNAGLEPQLGPLSAAYVLFLAIAGPIIVRITELLNRR